LKLCRRMVPNDARTWRTSRCLLPQPSHHDPRRISRH